MKFCFKVNAISNKLQRIQGSMLLKYDPELANHLKKVEVTPQVYGMYAACTLA